MAFLLTSAYARNFQGALDASCVHSTKAALTTYMYADATCYAGQVVAVTGDSTAANNGLYLIVTNSAYNSAQAKSASNSPFKALQYSTSASVDSAIANMAGVLKFQGELPNGSALSVTKFKKGYSWLVTTDTGTELSNGTVSYGAFDTAGVNLESGDLVICISGDTEVQFSKITAAQVSTYFAVINKNIERSVSSESPTAADGELAVFNGYSKGTAIKSGGQTLDSLKSECKNLANATGTLPIAKGGTGVTDLSAAKSQFGVAALEVDMANIKSGITAAGKATKLANARSLAYNHPLLGTLGEYSGNTFDGSANMAALAVDGYYTGSGIPDTITAKFAAWANEGSAVTVPDNARGNLTLLELATGSSCIDVEKRLQRFSRAYVEGAVPVSLKQVSRTHFVGEYFSNGVKHLACFFVQDNTFYLATMLLEGTFTEDAFKAYIEALEALFADLSVVFPVGTTFRNTSTGTAYVFSGCIGHINKFAAEKWQ